MTTKPTIDKSWDNILNVEFEKPYYKEIKKTVAADINSGIIIYPPLDKVLNAFEKTPLSELKVVILGQDPYHGIGQAHGLSFSVADGITFPPSLRNIFKELKEDIGYEIPTSGNLEKWSMQGVLMLNAILTVRASSPASHSKIGWEVFTNNVIKGISDNKEGIIFILWGNFAKNKKTLIDTSKHHIIEGVHPSPFSAYNGFFGSKPFSKCNEILRKIGKKEIDWKL